MIRPHLFKLFSLILFTALSIFAQTSTELHNRYKTTSVVESFEVRPGIIATFFFREDGQPFRLMVEPRFSYMDDLSKREISMKVADEILNELIPISTRGVLCEDYNGFQSGRNEYYSAEYENVHISRFSHNSGSADATVSTIDVSWRELSCPSEVSKPTANPKREKLITKRGH